MSIITLKFLLLLVAAVALEIALPPVMLEPQAVVVLVKF
jgi:hypothetical protein